MSANSSPFLSNAAQKSHSPAYVVMRIFLEQALEGRFTSKSWQKIIRRVTSEVQAWPEAAEVGNTQRVLDALERINLSDVGRELIFLYDPTARHDIQGELAGWLKTLALVVTYAVYGEFERMGWSDCMTHLETLLEPDLSGHSVEQYGIRKALCAMRFLEVYAPDRRAECVLALWDSRRAMIGVQLRHLCDSLVSLREDSPVEQLNAIPLEGHIGRLSRLAER